MTKSDAFRLQQAKHYADAEKSDPFAYRRAITHMNNRICGFTQDGRDAFYSAEPFQEERLLPDGTSYNVTIYRNIIRP